MLAAYLLTKGLLLYFCEVFERSMQCALVIFMPLPHGFSDPFFYPAFCLVFVLFWPIQFVLPRLGCVVFILERMADLPGTTVSPLGSWHLLQCPLHSMLGLVWLGLVQVLLRCHPLNTLSAPSFPGSPWRGGKIMSVPFRVAHSAASVPWPALWTVLLKWRLSDALTLAATIRS